MLSACCCCFDFREPPYQVLRTREQPFVELTRLQVRHMVQEDSKERLNLANREISQDKEGKPMSILEYLKYINERDFQTAVKMSLANGSDPTSRLQAAPQLDGQ